MIKYTENELFKRDAIIQTHPVFGNFLNKEIINTLINLFDNIKDEYFDPTQNIIKYIENERKERGLNTINLEVESFVYGENAENSTLFLKFKKNNNDYIHLSIHLAIKSLKPYHNGMIHIYKDIYKPNVSNKKKHLLYALISVEKPKNRPNSLKFSIADGYNTNPIIKDIELYDKDIQKEMDAIISVLNKLFDETDKEYYVGNDKNIFFIHNKTNKVLTNMNTYTTHITRKNIGKMFIQLSNNTKKVEINRSRSNRKTRRRKITKYNVNNTLNNVAL